MKIRIGLSLVVLLAIVALVGCSQLPTEMVPPAPAEEAVQGQEVAGRAFRLWSAPQKRPADLAYQIEGGRVYSGIVRPSNIVLSFNSDRIFGSPSPSGNVEYEIEGKRMWEGPRVSGRPTVTIEDNGRVYAGTQSDPILYTIRGDRLYDGPRVDPRKIVFQASDPIRGTLRFVVVALALAEQ